MRPSYLYNGNPISEKTVFVLKQGSVTPLQVCDRRRCPSAIRGPSMPSSHGSEPRSVRPPVLPSIPIGCGFRRPHINHRTQSKGLINWALYTGEGPAGVFEVAVICYNSGSRQKINKWCYQGHWRFFPGATWTQKSFSKNQRFGAYAETGVSFWWNFRHWFLRGPSEVVILITCGAVSDENANLPFQCKDKTRYVF